MRLETMENINKIKIVSTSTSNLLNAMYKETSYTETENGALTFSRSSSALLDFYAQAGATRKTPERGLELFKTAFSEDRLIAIKLLFYFRDVRGGQGERTLFRNCLEWLGSNFEDIFEKIVKYVPEYGRWDDILFDNATVFNTIKEQIQKDLQSENPSLLAKWLPTINASSASTQAKAKLVAKNLDMNAIEYRKKIRLIRKKIKAVEEVMSAQKWTQINYSSVPSQASRIYRKAFKKHDETRYTEFIEKAEQGKSKINASTLYPYQIFESVYKSYDKTLEALWSQLPDYTQGKNALVVADTSGSMSGQPMSVSVSLALYFAERNLGQFKDYFISFSEQPKLHKVQGQTLLEKMNSIQLGDIANTNLQRVFDLILDTGVNNNIPQSEMPEVIYIISDMEFDECTKNKTNYEIIKQKYAEHEYKAPTIVFWQVNSKQDNLPVQKDEYGVTLVSGFSPSIFKMAVENKTPYQSMLDTINQERYSKILIN
jgi:Domain of unknown function (DUF2828)